MPKRARTRAQDRAYRIATERNHNHHTRQTTRQARYDHPEGKAPPNPDHDPPPF
ncbi:hypothetical protein [Mycobacterium asiaticum]|uniref:hypothetical protein n=1 Tax=Mycobacterium asiaticum TaxID=1790 RepID=UPI001E52299F|nr:hypothetical protein [Mycobacterium asiaticum]